MEVATASLARRRPRMAALLLSLALPAFALAAEPSSPAPVAPAERVLRVGTSGDYSPFSFPRPAPDGSADAGLDGFDIELSRRFASDRGYRLELVRFRWPELAGDLVAGRFDVAMSGVTVRPERSIAGRLSVPVAATHAVALTWTGSGATSFEELDKPQRRVAVNAGGHLEKVAREVFRRAHVIAIADNDAVKMALLDRTYDAVVTDNYEEKAWTAAARGVVRLGPLSDDRKACLLPADRSALAAELDRWLIAREKDGTLAALRRRYFAEDAVHSVVSGKDGEPLQTAQPLAALASAILERQALMPLVYEAKRHAGAPIEDARQEEVVLERAVRTAAAEAAAAGVPAPNADGVRALFAALVAIGKDTQQKLADLDAKRRPPALRPRLDAGTSAGSDVANAGDGASEGNGTDDGKATAAGQPLPPSRTPATVRDLATELRPAIARVGEKIAVILVAMDAPVAAAEARRVLANALASSSIRPERLEAVAEAIALATSTRGGG